VSAQFGPSVTANFVPARSLALRALGLAATSAASATIGRRVNCFISCFLSHMHAGKPGGQTQVASLWRRNRLTRRSSRE